MAMQILFQRRQWGEERRVHVNRHRGARHVRFTGNTYGVRARTLRHSILRCSCDICVGVNNTQPHASRNVLPDDLPTLSTHGVFVSLFLCVCVWEFFVCGGRRDTCDVRITHTPAWPRRLGLRQTKSESPETQGREANKTKSFLCTGRIIIKPNNT